MKHNYRRLLQDTLGWGIILWVIGYILGIVLYAFVPAAMIGWAIMPVGVVLTLWVLLKKIDCRPRKEYLIISIAWTLIAIIFDYLFLVRLFHPADGYYKPDVYLYYVLMFLLPLYIGCRENNLKIPTY